MDNSEELPTLLSVCTGYGGLDTGVARAVGGLRTLVNVEVEAFAIANLVAKMEAGKLDSCPVWTDVKTFPSHLFSGYVDVLTGGYPCQPFSFAGKRLGPDDPRHLWPDIVRVIKTVQPGYCFFENVEGHITKGLREVLTDLVKLGYRVENGRGEPTWGVFSAAEIGAPHQRKRVFILAALDDPGGPEFNWISESENRAIREPGVELAHSCVSGPQRQGNEGAAWHRDMWPARPGQPQYPWEEPRVLADNERGVSQRRPGPGDVRRQRKPKQAEKAMPGGRGHDEPQKIEPQLGGAFNGPSHRVDRLRLLGNGVVPQVAEKAFRTLYGRMVNDDK